MNRADLGKISRRTLLTLGAMAGGTAAAQSIVPLLLEKDGRRCEQLPTIDPEARDASGRPRYKWKFELPIHDATTDIPALNPPAGRVFHGIAPEYQQGATQAAQKKAREQLYGEKYPPKFYEVRMKQFKGEILAGVQTTMWGYQCDHPEATCPGPTYKTRLREPLVIRYHNQLTVETSVHFHGGHTPAHSDGHPLFFVEPGKARDYYYPNGVPKKPGKGPSDFGDDAWDFSESGSTMWYHDHGNDITAHNALMGLSGFLLCFDEEEERWIRDGVLPWTPLPWHDNRNPSNLFPVGTFPPVAHKGYDIPIVLQDKCILNDGSIHFDPFDHNGYLGNIQMCNGKAYPTLEVEPTTYRFRLLNGSLARVFLTGFIKVQGKNGADTTPIGDEPHEIHVDQFRIGKDSWLYPRPIKKSYRASDFDAVKWKADRSGDPDGAGVDYGLILLGMANRADVIVDFSQYAEGDVLYLVNWMDQKDGRGPGGGDNDDQPGANPLPRGKFFNPRKLDTPHRLLRIVIGKKQPHTPAPCRVATEPVNSVTLREHEPIKDTPDASHDFSFVRRQGAWQINNQFYNERRADSVPKLNGVEKWRLINKSGGWWHPIHIHLESHQQTAIRTGGQTLTGDDIPFEYRWKHDTTTLGPNMEVDILMRFRTFEGPFVFHCHNLNHEDMRMMTNFDPRRNPEPSPARIERWFEGKPGDPGWHL